MWLRACFAAKSDERANNNSERAKRQSLVSDLDAVRRRMGDNEWTRGRQVSKRTTR
jgi:hypothetical protein